MLTSTCITIWIRLLGSTRPTARGDRGASFVEYAFLVALIAIVCMGAVTLLGSTTSGSASHSAELIAAAN